MMTSLGQRGDARQVQDVGFAAYLTKPVRHQHLHDCLALALGRRSDGAGATAAADHQAHDRRGPVAATAGRACCWPRTTR